jgi:hypothetical protein
MLQDLYRIIKTKPTIPDNINSQNKRVRPPIITALVNNEYVTFESSYFSSSKNECAAFDSE